MSVLDLSGMILNRQVQEFKVRYWLIDGCDGAYCVGMDGSLWTRWVNLGRGNYIVGTDADWRLLKLNPNTSGYLSATLYLNGVQTQVLVNRLVAEYFIPKPLLLPNIEVCHEDGVKTNNHLCNLRWDSRLNNQRDRIRHGTDNRGERCGNAKITYEEADIIRAEYAQGNSLRKLARLHVMSPTNIRAIVHNKTWVR